MKSTRWSTLALSSCVLSAALVLPVVAQAGSQGGPPTEVVRFADLNLDTTAGVRVLYSRIRQAALDVCGPLEPVGTPFPSAAWRSCIDQAIATAVRSVDRPLLTAYHEREVGHVIATARPLVTAGE